MTRQQKAKVEGRYESAKLNAVRVGIELEPDMDYFSGTGDKASDNVLEGLIAGNLSGQELEAALSSLRGVDFDQLPCDLSPYLDSGEEAARRAALAVLSNSGPLGLAIAWDAVKDGGDPLAMLAVMKVASGKGGAELGPVLVDGIAAAHPQIRYDAMEMVDPLQGRDEQTRRNVLEAAATSAYPDTALAAISQLSSDPRKGDLAILFNFLDHPDREVSASARGSIDFLIDTEFETSGEARVWWEENEAGFDDELSPRD